MALIVWSVFCLGVGLLLGAESDPRPSKGLMLAFGIACSLWAAGYALWAFASGVAPG